MKGLDFDRKRRWLFYCNGKGWEQMCVKQIFKCNYRKRREFLYKFYLSYKKAAQIFLINPSCDSTIFNMWFPRLTRERAQRITHGNFFGSGLKSATQNFQPEPAGQNWDINSQEKQGNNLSGLEGRINWFGKYLVSFCHSFIPPNLQFLDSSW